jgi:hypothetical protein
MDRQKKNSAIPILLIVAGCALYMVSGGIMARARFSGKKGSFEPSP